MRGSPCSSEVGRGGAEPSPRPLRAGIAPIAGARSAAAAAVPSGARPAPAWPCILFALLATGCAASPSVTARAANGEPAAAGAPPEIRRPRGPASATVVLPARVRAGGLLAGRVGVGARVACGDRFLPVDPNGNIAWRVPDDVVEIVLRVTRADGRVLVQHIAVDR